MVNNKSISLSSIRTATRRLAYFFRRGNKENREVLLRKLIYRRALKVSAKQTVSSSTELFQSFFLSATPFVGLKTRRRRRGKRLIAKIAILERDRAERSSFVALANILQISGASSKPFIDRLERELEGLVISSEQKPVHSSIREKRDEAHKLAFASRPYRWRRRSHTIKSRRPRRRLRAFARFRKTPATYYFMFN